MRGSLRATDITFSYRSAGERVQILKGLSLSVAPGELVAISGPSGSGKSTLLYMLGGFLKPDGGDIEVSGQKLTRLSGVNLAFFRSRTIGFVFQQFHLLPRTSVLDNILLSASYPSELQADRERARERALELAELVGLGAHLDKSPNQLSGGQQQRTAIARALLNDPDIILGDEPTGNLDSKTAHQILDLLIELNKRGKTVVIITHDPAIANRCQRVIRIEDGFILENANPSPDRPVPTSGETLRPPGQNPVARLFNIVRRAAPIALRNMWRNKARSVMTMLGVAIGIASLLSMITVGDFTQRKILEGYETLGVNKVMVRGYKHWNFKAADKVKVNFNQFDWNKDVSPMRKTFPEVARVSPFFFNWNKVKVHYAGRDIKNEVNVVGIGEDFTVISDWKVVSGSPINRFHVKSKSPVCLIGFQIAKRLFAHTTPLGKPLTVTTNEAEMSPYSCRVIGVLESKTSNDEWTNPDYQILVPYTFFTTVNPFWTSQFHEFALTVKPGTDVEGFSKAVKAYYVKKYGKSGIFNINSDSILVGQLKQFLALFQLLLGAIAGVTLLVGGMGITNMMMASLSEQLKEVGLRKAMGATDFSLRVQYLLESLFLCGFAGLFGLTLGVSVCQLVIFLASKVVAKIQFEWVIAAGPVIFSSLAIVVVGILSGLIPALKAERLQVIEALRSE